MTHDVNASMRSRRCAQALLGFCFMTSLTLSGATLADDNVVRVQETAPTSGKFVRSARGYMVAYDQVIPGTDETIRMIPVPGGVIELQPPIEMDAVDVAGTPNSTTTPKLETTRVELQPFWISETEITMKQLMPYRQLYYRIKKKLPDDSEEPLKFGHVDGVTGPTDVYAPDVHFEYAMQPGAAAPSGSQYMARQYTKWLSLLTKHEYRLPRRSEWKHACRASVKAERATNGDETEPQPTATDLDRHAVYAANAGPEPSLLVRRKLPNAWALFDMQGNAAEWVIEDTAPTGLRYGHVAMGGHIFSDAEDCQCDSMIRSSSSWWEVDPDVPPSPWWTTSGDGLLTGFRIIAPLRPMSNEEKQLAWEPDSKELLEDVRDRIEQGRGTFDRAQ
jgi:formylglycine-generating enzyme